MTTVGNGLSIVNRKILHANNDWSEIRNKDKLICLTRDRSLFFTLNYHHQALAVQFRFNTNSLRTTHKLIPFSFFGAHHDDRDRRESKFNNGGFYKPTQWDKHDNFFYQKGSNNPILNRMESEEYTNKDIPINNKYVTEIQVFITTDEDDLYEQYMFECHDILSIRRHASDLNIACNLYDSDTGRRISDTFWDMVKRCAKAH